MVIQYPLQNIFQHSRLPFLTAKVSKPFHIHAMKIWQKESNFVLRKVCVGITQLNI